MENPFNFSDEKLKKLLNAYFEWVKRNDNEAEYVENERKKAEIRRKALLNKDYISKLSDEELADEILKYVKALEGPVGIKLGKPRVSGEIEKIRRNILYFIDSEEDPFRKAERILEGDYKIPIFHKAFWSPLFQGKYPELLPNWNNKTDNFMRKIGVNLTTSKKTIEEKYRLYSEALQYLKELYPGCDFFDLDHLTHYGVAIDEGVKLIDKLISPSFENDLGKNTKYWRVVLPLDTKDYVVWPKCKENGLIAISYLKNPKAPDVNKMKNQMKVGDKVVAYLEQGRVGGIGTITGEFEDYSDMKPKDKDLFNGQFWRRRKVKWDHLPQDKDFWKLKDVIPGVHATIFELNKEQYEEALKEIGIIQPPDIDTMVELYPKEEVLKEIFIPEKEFDQIVKLLKDSKKKQIILQGPPGTGKTFIAQRIARYITQNDSRIETIQFHPSYSYEDFIEGYRPSGDRFELRDGIFKEFCKKASTDTINNYVLIIDEINRGNLSKIFGELLYLLEYRNQRVRLTYSQDVFSLPENLYIIGTMNTADRSLAIMDYALRRRFYFIDIKCETKRLEAWLIENSCALNTSELIGAIENMNIQIKDEMHSEDFAIGHSYFMRAGLDSGILKEVMDYGVKPLLKEYFFDKEEKVEEITAIMNKFCDKKIMNNNRN